MDHRAVLERVVSWARGDENIRAVVLTGSLARGDGSADAESDLDVELYVESPDVLLEDDAWYSRFGEVLVVEALENDGWNPTRLIYYSDGKIDFTIGAIGDAAREVEYDRPFQVLVDKDGLGSSFRPAPAGTAQPPSHEEFRECVNWFHAAVIMWAKYLGRGDLWAGKLRDWESKGQLLRMMEWDHKARYGWGYDTWHLGVQLRRWVDSDLVERIERCWSGAAHDDGVRALWASLDLFDALQARTALAVGTAPFDSSGVRARVARLLNGPGRSSSSRSGGRCL